MSVETLCTFSKLPTLNTAIVLIVGSQGVGKHQLAKSVVDCPSSISIQCRTATSLPLPAENSGSRPRIDLVVFIIDLTNKHSYSEVEKSLNHLDRQFFLGKVCFVASGVRSHKQLCIENETVTQLADNYDSPVLWVDLEDDVDKRELAQKLVKKLQMTSGFCSTVSPLLIDTTRQRYEADLF